MIAPMLVEFGAVKLLLSATLAPIVWIVARRSGRPQVAHALWLLLLVAMLAPSVVHVPLVDWLPFVATRVAPAIAGRGSVADGVAGAVVSGASAIRGALTPSLLDAMLLLWFGGSTAILIVSLRRIARFHRMLRSASRSAPPTIQRLAALAAADLATSSRPVHLVEAAVPPLVWWSGFHPCVVLPAALATQLSDTHLRWILTHEAAHIRRGDYLARWVEWLAGIAFWWNPITWIARRQLRVAEEICCDELVLSHARPESRSYASALLNVVEYLSQSSTLPTPASAMAAASGRTHALERRLSMIVTHASRPAMSRRSRGMLWTACAATVALGFLNIDSLVAREPSALSAASVAQARGQDECGGLIALTRAATAAGQITPEEGKQRIAACLDAQALAELREGVAAGLITEDQAREKLAARRAERRGDTPPADPTKQAEIERIKASVRAGTIAPEDAKAQLVALTQPTADECEPLRAKANAAIQVSAVDAERMLAKVNIVCGNR
jgi:beta-lactamase regulating signal transducer with metallopeptidase domain